MPRKAKVDVSDAINAICQLGSILKDGNLPAYTNAFYAEVAKLLDGKWTGHDVYINLRENRRDLKTKVFERLGIKIIPELEETKENVNSFESSNSSTQNETSENQDVYNSSLFSGQLLEGEQIFDLVIRDELWKKMEPISKNYKGRNVTVLPPGVWSDIIADEFWKQYKLPCAFSFKSHTVSQNSENSNASIINAHCKSNKCKNKFIAVAKKNQSTILICGFK